MDIKEVLQNKINDGIICSDYLLVGKQMSLGNCIVYRATKLETFVSRFLPYYLPFINKRKRVRIRNYFRYAYQRRLMKDMTNALKEIYVKDPFESIQFGKWGEEDYSWEVIN